jgi:hypothetical protein
MCTRNDKKKEKEINYEKLSEEKIELHIKEEELKYKKTVVRMKGWLNIVIVISTCIVLCKCLSNQDIFYQINIILHKIFC